MANSYIFTLEKNKHTNDAIVIATTIHNTINLCLTIKFEIFLILLLYNNK